MSEDDTTLENLPRMQTHRFETWGIDEAICERCGGPRAAHPSEELLAAHPEWDR